MTWEEDAHPRGEHGKWAHLAGIGRAEHPNVTEYRSGGIGHLPGDESRSVVGFMDPKALIPYREHSGIQNPGAGDHDEKRIGEIQHDIESGEGIHEPISVEWDANRQHAYIGEGNHRLEAALRAGAKTVPVRVNGRGHAERQINEGVGAPLTHTGDFEDGGRPVPGYAPPAVHPAHFDWSPTVGEGGAEPGRASDWGREADDQREYAGLHQPNNAAPLHDLTSTETVPEDFYSHMHYYQYGDPEHDKESARAIKAARGNPDKPVTIYRAAPAGVTHINHGDWITLSRKYAEQHAMQDNDPSHDWPVHEAQVPAKHIGWDGNDINEFGYFGDEPVPVSGRHITASADTLQPGGGLVADKPTPATTTLAGTCSGPGPCDVHPFGHGKNWVNKVGGLPEYIRAIAHALARQGHSESAAIATAVATVKRWAAGGGHVKPDTRARAAKAVSEWEAKKAAASIADAEAFALGVDDGEQPVEAPDVSHAGLALKAADTGRVLMLQRGIDTPDDPAAGKWEFPGGGLEPDDATTLHGAVREWQEEVGQPLPKGGVVAETWTAPNGIYQGHVVVIPEEKSVVLHEGRQLLNPDDPHGGGSEQVAWWDPEDAAQNPALREEVKSTPWDLIKNAGGPVAPVEDDEEENPAGRAVPEVFSMAGFIAAFADLEDFAAWNPSAHPRSPTGQFAPLGQGAGYSKNDQKGQQENKQVKAIQRMLVHLGIGVGPEGVDGMLGPHTGAAIEKFQKQHGMKPTGIVDQATLSALKVAGHAKVKTSKTAKAKATKRPQVLPGLRPTQAPGMLPDSAIPRQPAQVYMPGYRPNPIVADGTSFEGVPAISLTQPADPGAEFDAAPEGKVYHYKHGWVSLDHPAAKRNTGLIKEGNLMHRDGEVHEITGVSATHVRIKSPSGKVRHLPLSEARSVPIRRPDQKPPEVAHYPAIDDIIKRLREHGLSVDESTLSVDLDVADMSLAIEGGDVFASSNRWIRKRGNKWVIIQKGTGKVLQSHDSQGSAEAGFRAMMKSKYGGQAADVDFGDETPYEEEIAVTASAYTDEDVAALVAAAVTEQPPIEVGEDTGGGVPFKIPLVLPTGIETGDRREFKAGGVSSRDLPLPLLWQRLTDDGHKQASIVGRIDRIEPTKNGLGKAEGVFDTGDDAQEALRLVRGLFLRGVSGDVDKIDAEMSQGEDGKPKVIFDKGRLTAATLVAKPAFAECMIELPGDKEWESNMGRLREEGGAPAPLVAAGGPMNPPSEWFQNPNLSEPTHLEVTDDGRVFGHIAAWNQDHIGMPFQKPPRSNSGYRYFTTGQIKTAEGELINVGQLTLVGGHADLTMTADMAVKHYDDTNSAVADVVVGEDQFGIWVAGAQRPDLSEHQVRAFRASDPSGDWRPINGNLELVACCQVNVPGFPIPRARVASAAAGSPVITALVAAGAIARHRHDTENPLAARVAALEAVDNRRRMEVAQELRATVAAGKAMLIKQTKQALVASADELAATEFDSPIFDGDAGSEDMTGVETDDVSAAR